MKKAASKYKKAQTQEEKVLYSKQFKDIYAYLTQTKAAKLSSTREELLEDMKLLLANDEHYTQACEDSLKIFKENSGAVDFVINVLSKN